jgi:hypothetical protein
MSDDILQRLALISLQLNRIVPIFQLVLGTFGNIMNILIFTRRSLRNNPCSLYFLASSVNNIFVLYIAALTRLLSSGWNIDPSNSNLILCKLRMFFVYTSFSLIQWFMVLASIDRYLSSCRNIHHRQMSSLSVARKAIGLTILILALAHFHTLIWMTLGYIDGKTYCNIFNYNYTIVFEVFFLLLTCTLPLILMTLFGILTIINVRKSRTQVAPQTNEIQRKRLRSKDRQLIVMFLVQVFATLFCTLPFSVANLTSMIFQYLITISEYGNAVNTFYINISRNITYFTPVISFYIYTLSSQTFRTEIKSMIVRTRIFILTKLGFER